jgi:hypothetical protein
MPHLRPNFNVLMNSKVAKKIIFRRFRNAVASMATVGMLILFFSAQVKGQFQSQSLPLQNASVPVQVELPHASVKFVENKGQWRPGIDFIADVPGGRVFFQGNRIAYSFADVSNLHDRYLMRKEGREAPLTLNCHGIFLDFMGPSNGEAIAIGENRRPEIHNYFIGNDPSQWAGDVGCFNSVRYAELYPGIDLRLFGKETTFKYELVVAPGADANVPALTK